MKRGNHQAWSHFAATLVVCLSLLGPWTGRMEDLVEWFLSGIAPSSAGSDQGCGLDPNGNCFEAMSAQSRDNGCGLDPDGRCAPSQPEQGDEDGGCGIDPDGCS